MNHDSSIEITLAKDKSDFDGIMSLHKRYYETNLSELEKRKGFLSTKLTLKYLSDISQLSENRILVSKENSKVSSYMIYVSRD